MILSATVVYSYLAGMDQVDVRKEDQSPGFSASREEAYLYMAANTVAGHGSRSKLRFLRLLCSPEEAREKALAQFEAYSTPARRRQKRMLPLDVLQRMVSDRKFTFKEPMMCAEGGVQVKSGLWTFAHKTPTPGFGFSWSSR